ncbi:hypothetical protein BH10PSE7_BH10PSE7_00870 [soil metagenome]
MGGGIIANKGGKYDLAKDVAQYLDYGTQQCTLWKLESGRPYQHYRETKKRETDKGWRLVIGAIWHEVPPAVRQRAEQIVSEVRAVKAKRDAIHAEIRTREKRCSRTYNAGWRAAEHVIKCKANTVAGIMEKMRLFAWPGLMNIRTCTGSFWSASSPTSIVSNHQPARQHRRRTNFIR